LWEGYEPLSKKSSDGQMIRTYVPRSSTAKNTLFIEFFKGKYKHDVLLSQVL